MPTGLRSRLFVRFWTALRAAVLVVLAPVFWVIEGVEAENIVLAWDPPTLNSDGSPLTDLSHYVLKVGRAKGQYDTIVSHITATSHDLDTLGAGDYWAVVTAVDLSGNESIASNELTFSVSGPTLTATPTATATRTRTVTPTVTRTPTTTVTATRTVTPTRTQTATPTPTRTGTRTPTSPSTPAKTMTATPAVSATGTPGAGQPTPTEAPPPAVTVTPLRHDDADGDGVPNPQDNCAAVFNPVQADWNQNRIGDACETMPSRKKVRVLDFDGDGVSDIGYIDRSSREGAVLTTSILLSSGGEPKSQSVSFRDQLAPADYDGDGRTDLATVKMRPVLRWVIFESATGRRRVRPFGVRGDMVIVGCAFDRDARADPAILSPQGVLQMIPSGSGKVKRTELLLPAAMSIKDAICADLTGDGRDEVLVLAARNFTGRRATPRSRTVLVGFHPDGKSLLSLPAPGALGIMSADVNADGKEEAGYFAAAGEGGAYQVRFFAGKGTGPAEISLPPFRAITSARFRGRRGRVEDMFLIELQQLGVRMIAFDGGTDEVLAKGAIVAEMQLLQSGHPTRPRK